MRYYHPGARGFPPNSLFARPWLTGPGRKLEDYCNKKLSAEFITANKFGSGPVAAARRLSAA